MTHIAIVTLPLAWGGLRDVRDLDARAAIAAAIVSVTDDEHEQRILARLAWTEAHLAQKATWLYEVGCALADLKWGSDPDSQSNAIVSWCSNHVSSSENRPCIGKSTASRTPIEFREVLISMARSVASKEIGI